MLDARTSLREYQQHLFDRLRATVGAEARADCLAFDAGESTWLVPLSDLIEIVPVPRIVAVPFVQDWFVGVANVRGSLIAVSDFGRFIDSSPTPITPESRLILLHPRHRARAALLVRRIRGLRQMTALIDCDERGKFWRKTADVEPNGVCRTLRVQYLVRDAHFLQAARRMPYACSNVSGANRIQEDW
jgi:twitching motility protein PilI